MATVDAVLRAARSWLGTPFAHQGRQKGVRCDCIGLVIEVCREVGLVDAAGLPADWNHTGYGRFPDSYGPTQALLRYFTRVEPRSTMRPGDLALFRTVRGEPAHMGWLGDAGDPWSLIHAYAARTIPQARVQEHRLGPHWLARLHSVYRLPLAPAHGAPGATISPGGG